MPGLGDLLRDPGAARDTILQTVLGQEAFDRANKYRMLDPNNRSEHAMMTGELARSMSERAQGLGLPEGMSNYIGRTIGSRAGMGYEAATNLLDMVAGTNSTGNSGTGAINMLQEALGDLEANDAGMSLALNPQNLTPDEQMLLHRYGLMDSNGQMASIE